MSEMAFLGLKSTGVVFTKQFVAGFLPAFSQNCTRPLQGRKARTVVLARAWIHYNVDVFRDEHQLVQQRNSIKLLQIKKTGKRVVATHASSGFVSDNRAGFQENGIGSGVESEKEKKKEIVKEKVRRAIAGVDQTQLVDPWLLADPDSRFAEFYGVQIHHKIARPIDDVERETVGVPAILLHGFGASSFSWERVMPKLAQILGESVLAFDRPAFGLTSRLFPGSEASEKAKAKFRNVYTAAFSAAATVAFVNFIQAEQAILIGHSAGSIIAAEAYHQAPEKIAAIIFVAPALVAPLILRQMEEGQQSNAQEKELERDVKGRESNPALKVWAALRWVYSKVKDFAREVGVFLSLAFAKLMGFLLRSTPGIWLVRKTMDKGGPAAVRLAFFDASKADKYVLDGYTKPLGCRDWERALIEYSLAMIDNSKEQASGKKRLEDITCPVLVVTGDTDRLVPTWNAERLAKVFPNSEFKKIRNCGHLPQEETPDELLEVIKDFLARNLQQGGRNRAKAAVSVGMSITERK